MAERQLTPQEVNSIHAEVQGYLDAIESPDGNGQAIPFTLLMGETGSGKSTLLNMIAGCVYQRKRDSLTIIRTQGEEVSEARGGSEAVTSEPFWVDSDGKRFVDMPGLKDSQGDYQRFRINLMYAVFFQSHLMRDAVIVTTGSNLEASRNEGKKLMSPYLKSGAKMVITGEVGRTTKLKLSRLLKEDGVNNLFFYDIGEDQDRSNVLEFVKAEPKWTGHAFVAEESVKAQLEFFKLRKSFLEEPIGRDIEMYMKDLKTTQEVFESKKQDAAEDEKANTIFDEGTEMGTELKEMDTKRVPMMTLRKNGYIGGTLTFDITLAGEDPIVEEKVSRGHYQSKTFAANGQKKLLKYKMRTFEPLEITVALFQPFSATPEGIARMQSLRLRASQLEQRMKIVKMNKDRLQKMIVLECQAPLAMFLKLSSFEPILKELANLNMMLGFFEEVDRTKELELQQFLVTARSCVIEMNKKFVDGFQIPEQGEDSRDGLNSPSPPGSGSAGSRKGALKRKKSVRFDVVGADGVMNRKEVTDQALGE